MKSHNYLSIYVSDARATFGGHRFCVKNTKNDEVVGGRKNVKKRGFGSVAWEWSLSPYRMREIAYNLCMLQFRAMSTPADPVFH